MRHFRKVTDRLNPEPLLRQLAAQPQLWNQGLEAWKQRKQGSALYDTDGVIILRDNKSSAPGLNDWSKPVFSVLSAAQDLLLDVMRAIPGEHLGKIVISRMKPGEK